MFMLDKVKEDDREERFFQKVELGVIKNNG